MYSFKSKRRKGIGEGGVRWAIRAPQAHRKMLVKQARRNKNEFSRCKRNPFRYLLGNMKAFGWVKGERKGRGWHYYGVKYKKVMW